MAEPKSVALVGTGLIGGSIGLALRRAGVTVRGFDRDAEHAAAALDAGAVDELAPDLAAAVADADLTVVAVPVGHVADVVVEVLDAGAGLVTDVGSVKAPVVAAVEAARPEAVGALRGWSSDGGVGAGGPRRRQRRPVRGCHLGAHARPAAPTPRCSRSCARG